MKTVLTLLSVMLLGSSVLAASPCQYQCNTECRRYAEELNQELQTIYSLCNGVPARPNPPRPITPEPRPPVNSAPVEMYYSDSCRSDHVGTVNLGSDCSVFKNQKVWGIKINGQCFNTVDMNGDLACEAFKAGGDPQALEIYYSDSCSNDLVAKVNDYTRCDLLKNQKAWGIKVNGKCENIADTSADKACEMYKSAGHPHAVRLYYSDSCRDSMIAVVTPATNCQTLKSISTPAWGIQVNGKCINITDRSAFEACEAYKNAALSSN